MTSTMMRANEKETETLVIQKAHLQQTYAPAPCVFINRGGAGCGLVPLCLPPFPARLNYTALTQPWIHGPVSLQPAPLGTDTLQSPTRHIRG